MSDWIWVDPEVALAIHLEQLAEWGGGEGVRDEGLFQSAMARPRNLASYRAPDAPALAASYAYGLARNHPFIDGNKRAAAVVSETFLNDNGYVLEATNAEVAVIFTELAAGDLIEDELAEWFRARVQPA